MLSPLNPSNLRFLNDLSRISDRMDRAQREISSGVRVAKVSDDPDQVSTILEVRASLNSNQQILSNLGRIKTEVDTGEQSMESAVQLFDKVQVLGAQGATDTQTADSRATIAQELGSILEQMVGLARTNVEGRYVFSGDADQVPPYSIDLTQPIPISTYAGSAATRLVQHPNGTTFSVSKTAQEIFDSSDPSTNVFTSILNLRTALLNNDTAAIDDAVSGLKKVGNYLNQELSFYGTTQNKVAEATDFGNQLDLQLQQQLSGLQDTDLSQAIIDLNQAQLQQQAALKSRASIPTSTLFDYLT